MVIFLSSCGQKMEEKVIETFPDGKPKKVQYFRTVDGENYMAREINYYQNGHKKQDGYYNPENQKHGKWIYWREDGKKWSEGYFYEGKDDGMRKIWHENGARYYEGKYDKGIRVGTWKFWDENGKLVKEIDYDKGKD
jgi:antitoxin component YwqK of YwqJK toxin-antitoxin module